MVFIRKSLRRTLLADRLCPPPARLRLRSCIVGAMTRRASSTRAGLMCSRLTCSSGSRSSCRFPRRPWRMSHDRCRRLCSTTPRTLCCFCSRRCRRPRRSAQIQRTATHRPLRAEEHWFGARLAKPSCISCRPAQREYAPSHRLTAHRAGFRHRKVLERVGRHCSATRNLRHSSARAKLWRLCLHPFPKAWNRWRRRCLKNTQQRQLRRTTGQPMPALPLQVPRTAAAQLPPVPPAPPVDRSSTAST